MSVRPLLVGLLTAGMGAGVLAAPSASAAACRVGSAGLGDPYFPLQGNGGYDASHYSLDVAYTPATGVLTGVAAITASAPERLCRFDLDLRGFDVASVRVDGRPAAFTRELGHELVITPARPVAGTFRVVVRYAGVPKTAIDPDGALDGFIPTDDGAFVASEPQGAPTWYPVNDSPRDKATYDIAVTVPSGLTAVSNGVLRSTRRHDGMVRYAWHNADPTASYLVTATIGKFQVRRGRTPGGVPYYNAVDPGVADISWPVLRKLPAIVDYYSATFGPYPFDSVGAIVDDAKQVGYALETQTRPVFDRAVNEGVVAHELAHQWFGDAVTLRTWPDIWLHEGFATFVAWLWEEHTGGPTVQQTFDEIYATPASASSLWRPPPGAPQRPRNLFAGSVYVRGGLALQALRAKIGDADFFQILRTWVATHRYDNASIPQFEALAERVTGRDLTHFFTVWLERPGKPRSW